MANTKKKKLTEEQLAECEKLRNIFESRKKTNGFKQADLSQKLGVSQSAISHYFNGINALNISAASNFANILGVTVDEFSPRLANEIKLMLDAINPDKTQQNQSLIKHKNELSIKLFDAYAVAGNRSIINQEFPDIIKEIIINKDKALQLLGRKSVKNITLVNVPTDSMAPTINKGDIAFIDSACNYYDGEGVYMFVDELGELYIKRLQKIPTGIIKFLSDNPKYSTFELPQNKLEQCYILGKFIRALPLKMIEL